MILNNTKESYDPFAKLYLDKTVSAREIAEFILDYLRIDRDTLKIKYFSNKNLSLQQKILFYFLALKVMKLQKLRDTDTATPSRLNIELKELNPSSVRPVLRMLVKKHLLSYNDKTSEYFIRANQIDPAKAYIQIKER